MMNLFLKIKILMNILIFRNQLQLNHVIEAKKEFELMGFSEIIPDEMINLNIVYVHLKNFSMRVILWGN